MSSSAAVSTISSPNLYVGFCRVADFLLKTCALLAALLLVVKGVETSFFVLQSAPVNVDAGHHLSLGRALFQGNKLYNDVYAPYAPLAFYLTAPLFIFIDASTKDLFFLPIAYILVLHVFCGIGIFFCLRQESVPMPLALLGAALSFGIGLRMEGDGFFLEPVTLGFAILAFFFYRRGQIRNSDTLLLAAGVCSGLAFLCKQYGLAFALALDLGVLCSAQLRRRLPFVLCAQLLPLALAYWYFQPGIELARLFDAPGYLRNAVDWSSIQFLFLRFMPLSLVMLGAAFVRPQLLRNHALCMSWIFCAAIFPSLMIRPFLHYLFLLTPFLVLACILTLNQIRAFSAPLGLGLSLLLLPTVYSLLHKQLAWDISISRSQQLEIAQALAVEIPREAKVVLFAQPWLTYLLQLAPVGSARPSYLNAFHDCFSIPDMLKHMEESTWMIVDNADEGGYGIPRSRFRSAGLDWNQEAARAGYYRKSIFQGRWELWSKGNMTINSDRLVS